MKKTESESTDQHQESDRFRQLDDSQVPPPAYEVATTATTVQSESKIGEIDASSKDSCCQQIQEKLDQMTSKNARLQSELDSSNEQIVEKVTNYSRVIDTIHTG